MIRAVAKSDVPVASVRRQALKAWQGENSHIQKYAHAMQRRLAARGAAQHPRKPPLHTHENEGSPPPPTTILG